MATIRMMTMPKAKTSLYALAKGNATAPRVCSMVNKSTLPYNGAVDISKTTDRRGAETDGPQEQPQIKLNSL